MKRLTKTFRNGECHTLRPCCARYYIKLSKYEDKEEELNMSFDEMASFIKIIKKWSFIQYNYKKDYGTFTQFLCSIHTIGMKEDFEKIKEWLERK